MKSAYKQANSAYKKALSENTTYRKGVVRKEVGQDAARKYLSDAKKVKKQLDSDPSNKELKKKYNDLMSKHDIERAKARKATEASTNRMKTKATIKRKMTMGAKAAAGTAAAVAGAAVVNYYLKSHNVTVNGKSVSMSSETIRKAADFGKRIMGLDKYMY